MPALKTIQTAFVGEINVDLVFADVSVPLKDDGEAICGGFEQTMGSSTAIAACAYAGMPSLASSAYNKDRPHQNQVSQLPQVTVS